MEEWKVISFNPNYSISNYGRIKNSIGEIQEVRDNGNGYKKKFGKYVHRMVAEAFIPKIEGRNEVNHKNGNKADNRVVNLEWVTHRDNQIHMYQELDTPERKANRKSRMSGKNNPMYGKRSANHGKPMTEEQKKKISIARKIYWQKVKSGET